MCSPTSAQALADLTALGRVRLSEHFFMREMLYSEVANLYGVPNIPEDAEAAIYGGTQLCTLLLEPLKAAFGHVSIRSAYRSPTLNAFCHELHNQGVADSWCICNEETYAHHIWDRRDAAGHLGAAATVFIPGYLNYYERTRDWQALGWWLRDHIAHFDQVQFFPAQGAFNIRWYEGPNTRSVGYLDADRREQLTAAGELNFDGDHRAHYTHVLPHP